MPMCFALYYLDGFKFVRSRHCPCQLSTDLQLYQLVNVYLTLSRLNTAPVERIAAR